MRTLTRQQVRRAALAASGLDRDRPARVDVRHFRRVMADLDVVQLDSVNVVTRAHEMPFFSRLGAHDTESLRRWLWHSREAFECWAHVASLMAIDGYPLLRHRQVENDHPWDSVQRLMDEQPEYVEGVESFVLENGPVTLSDLPDPGERSTGFWGWAPGKQAMHWMFEAGRIAVHERTSQFVAAYDDPARVIPDEFRSRPAVPREEATDALLLRALRAQAVGTVDDLADHHRLPIREARAAMDRLVARGDVVPVQVNGWDRPAFADVDLRIPRTVRARALVCPFDPICWYRPRLDRLWDFEYRIEIYVPAAKRQYGYYVLPFLLGEAFVARVDLKADRKTDRLLVRGAWAEAGVDRAVVARELAEELSDLGSWLGTPEVVIADNGDLAPALQAA